MLTPIPRPFSLLALVWVLPESSWTEHGRHWGEQRKAQEGNLSPAGRV